MPAGIPSEGAPAKRTIDPASGKPAAGLPVVGHLAVQPAPADLERIARLAQRLLRAEPALANVEVFGPGVATGLGDGPALLFEDHSDIALFGGRGDIALQYRPLLLARTGDFVLIGGARNPAFEAYCRELLGLGTASVLGLPASAADRKASLARRCRAALEASSPIIQAARRHGQLNLIPYIGTGSAWQLAEHIARQTGARVHVAAPPPRLTRRVNDKLWFAARVKELLGGGALPPSYHAFGPAALTGRVKALAKRFQRVVIKVPDSAGSAGNVVLDAQHVRPLRARSLRRWLLKLLRNLGWRNRFPLMVGVWECAVLSSPSVQAWIPHAEAGLPVIEGVFDQVVEGEAGVFVGAVPSHASERWQRRLANEATLLACLFQKLGFFGRCSFDAVLVGNSEADAELHWIECNGRWGGTSIPMTLANRLVGDWARRALMIVQRTGLEHEPREFGATLERLGPRLLRAERGASGVVLLTPAGIETGTGMHCLILGDDEQALQREVAALEALLDEAAGERG